MKIFSNPQYQKAIKKIVSSIPIKPGNYLITGATGLIGSCLIDTLITAKENGCNLNIFGLSRNAIKLQNRFDNKINIIAQDICEPLNINNNFDFIIHAASNADPKTYSLYPAETIFTNIIGAKNTLDYCKNTKTRILLTSTFEVYGFLKKDEFSEDDFGVIDYNLIRSCYPESKRVSELLFRTYHTEYNVNSIIARLPSVYGPTMAENDSKAHAQFLRNALKHQDITLKSKGEQKRSYCYVMDVVGAILYILFYGTPCEAYNVSNSNSIATIADVATTIANLTNTKTIYVTPTENDKKLYNTPQNSVLKSSKLEKLGWTGFYTLEEGLKETLNILKGM